MGAVIPCIRGCGGFGQAVDEGVDARAGGGEARLQRVAFAGQRGRALLQQGIGALEFLVTQQQSFDSFGQLFDLGHGTALCCRGMEPHEATQGGMPQGGGSGL